MTKTIFVIALLALGFVAMTRAEEGHHGEGHDLFHAWYETLFNAQGISCCNDQDCRPTDHRTHPDGTIEVMVDGAWMKVPPETILKKAAPDLGTHVCAMKPFPGYPTQIVCVVLGNGV